jgi:hypothetical protein
MYAYVSLVLVTPAVAGEKSDCYQVAGRVKISDSVPPSQRAEEALARYRRLAAAAGATNHGDVEIGSSCCVVAKDNYPYGSRAFDDPAV